jgi:membrane-bound serine protease (ClpP class)
MSMKIFLGILIAIVVFEVIEHVVAPLLWAFFTRKKRSVSGPTGLLGQVAIVKHWEQGRGTVFVRGELWRAVSSEPMSVGDKAVVQDVHGLTLKVGRLVKR